MNFNDYQTKSRKTAGYPAIGHAVIYPTLGLVNEAGEVAGKIKKVFRDKDGRHIRESPYVPTVTAVPALTAGAAGIEIHRGAVVECAPAVGSYVGGDITAGLLCTELATNQEDVSLLLDIVTNGEIVVGNAEWKVACACSAGPAFEGSGIRCGMRATEGAIEHVEISPGGALLYRVVGGGRPAGICGSGLICLLGEMLKRGIVDRAGRLQSDDGRGFL